MVQTIATTQWKPPMKQFGIIGGVGAAIAALIVLMIITGSWYTIDQTQRGGLLRNGALVEVVQPGLHFKLPLIDNVVKIDMQTHTYSWAKVNSYSADQQPADLKISITVRASPGQGSKTSTGTSRPRSDVTPSGLNRVDVHRDAANGPTQMVDP